MTDRPSLLFLITDQQRADSIGMVQAGIEVTPNLNRLAAEGALFSRAYSTCPVCMPARAALATGTYPTANGVLTNDGRCPRATGRAPIQQILADAGYDVACIGVEEVHVAPPLDAHGAIRVMGIGRHAAYLKDLGLAVSLSASFRTPLAEQTDTGSVTRPYGSYRTMAWPHEAVHFADFFYAREAVRFLRTPRSRPFALFLGLPAPHPPLWVPEPYFSRFDPDGIHLPANVCVASDGEPPGRRRGIAARLAEGASPDDWRAAWSAHLGLTNLADTAAGEVLEALERSGQGDNTVVAFTSDHGEQLGQHGMYQKMEMYEPALRVPMVLRAPGADSRKADVPVSHLDLMPTLLDLMGLPVPEGLDGRSLAGAIQSGAGLQEQPVFAQYSGCFGIADIRRAVVSKRHKYVWAPGDEVELFDLQSDPLEMQNLAADPEHRPIREELHGLFRQWAQSHGDFVRV